MQPRTKAPMSRFESGLSSTKPDGTKSSKLRGDRGPTLPAAGRPRDGAPQRIGRTLAGHSPSMGLTSGSTTTAGGFKTGSVSISGAAPKGLYSFSGSDLGQFEMQPSRGSKRPGAPDWSKAAKELERSRAAQDKQRDKRLVALRESQRLKLTERKAARAREAGKGAGSPFRLPGVVHNGGVGHGDGHGHAYESKEAGVSPMSTAAQIRSQARGEHAGAGLALTVPHLNTDVARPGARGGGGGKEMEDSTGATLTRGGYHLMGGVRVGPGPGEIDAVRRASEAVGGDDTGGKVFDAFEALRTGEHAVTFFAHYGPQCPVKFVYLNRSRTGKVFRPYDLIVVPEEDIDPEHFTISAKGVVHVCPGEPSEFLTLSEWMRQSSAFNVVRNLTFFRQFVPRKMFDMWRTFAKYSKFRRMRRDIERKLFMASRVFCAPMMTIRTAVSHLQELQLVRLDGVRMTAATFADTQAQARAMAQKEIDRRLVRIVRVLKGICKDVTDRAAANADEDADPSAGAGGRTKGIREAKEDEMRKARALRQAAFEQSRLGSLIRMVDYMVVEAFAGRCSDDLEALRSSMHAGAGQRSRVGLFMTELRFDDEGTVFAPNQQDFGAAIEEVIGETVEMVTREPRMLSVRAFEPFLRELPVAYDAMAFGGVAPLGLDLGGARFTGEDPRIIASLPEGFLSQAHITMTAAEDPKSRVLGLGAPSVAEICYSLPSMRFKTVEVLNKLEEDFEGARAFSEMDSFKQVRPAFDYQKTQGLYEEAHASSASNGGGEGDASSAGHAVLELKREMQKIAGWDSAVRSLTSTTTRGCLHVDAKELKAELEPLTERALGRVKEQLLQRSSGVCRRLADIFQQRVSVFERRPQTLDDFARHKEDMARLQEDDTRLMEDAQVVDEMHKLVTTYRGRIPREDEFLAAEMKSLLGRYQDAMIQGKGFVESRMRDMRHQLDMRVFKLKETMAQLKDSVNEGEFVDASQDTSDVLVKVQAAEDKLSSMESRSGQFQSWQRLFGVEEDGFTAMELCKSSIQRRAILWRSLDDFISKHDHWVGDPFHTVDVDQLVTDSNALMKASYIADRQLGDDVSAMFKEKTQAWRSALGVIEELGNPYMLDRHWTKLYRELKQPFTAGDTSRTLGELIDFGVLEMRDLVTEVSGAASGEHQLEESLQSIAAEWTNMKFLTRNYRELKHVYVLSGLDDIFVLLEDHQVTLQTMMGSRFIQGVRDEVEVWDRKLALLSDTLDEWVQCMKQWQYLENIFSAEDIQRQLPAEASKFMTVDKRWKEVMLRTHTNPAVLASIENGDELLKTFQHCNMLLEEIQKSLDDYLETKRSAFPRFYFLSDEDLLAILSQTRDPQAVQPHLQGCFDAMKSLKFGKEDQAAEMFGMISSENEHVDFTAPLTAAGNVENWLGDVERMMRKTLYDITKTSMEAYPADPDAQINRKDWLFKYAAQPVLTVDQVFWAANVERAILEMNQDPEALARLLTFVRKQIDAMVELVRTDLTKLQRRMLGALVVLDVHGRDVVAALVKKQVSALEDFEWTRQLRYYWEEDVDNCVVRQTNTRFVFGYEYIGNQPRLVITPLTDKCYMTLTGALHLKFGGAPAGPAGTGKTETTKDLAKALAVQCVVFNCSDGLNFQMMGRFFSGLAQAGAWACFDEFNRINIEVLSVIAQQILVIQEGLKGGETHIEFEGKEIPLSSSFGVFITMNPGYAGRTELPDNLKSLFRPVAMMVPDYRLIAEIILFSQGFGEAFGLSNKMAQLYKLASEQLSKQSHYDYGMRAVKSVLVAAGQLKRKEPDVDETILLIRSMRDSNVPKFLQQDLPLFQGIIKDLFPTANVPFVDYGNLQEAIEFQLKLRGLSLVPGLITKIIQTHETQLVRHGMMLVGEAGSGKSINWQVLADALTQLKKDGEVDKDGFYQKVTCYVLNPKSVRMGELYGETSSTTGEWTDGIISALARVAVRDTSQDRKWIVFDGPVDALWIENMNTVLDDNKTLCLPNGQRIKLPPTLHMMFEVADLAVASPATVSRCGMVYMEFVHVGLDAIIETWSHGPIEDLLPEERDRLTALISQIAPQAISFLRESCRQVVPATDGNMLQSFLAMLDALLTPANGVLGSGFRRQAQSAAQKARERLLGGIGGKKPDKADDAAAAAAATSGAGAGESKEQDAPAPGDQEADMAALLLSDDLDGDDGEGSGIGMGMGIGGSGGTSRRTEGAMSEDDLTAVVNQIFTFAFVWSFGCNIHDSSRTKFQTFAKALLGQTLPDALKEDDADLYDFYVDVQTRTVKPWKNRMDAFEYTPGTPYFDLVVPTIDTTRYAYLFKTLVEHGRGVYFSGETGVGKSVIVSDTVQRMCTGDEAQFVTKTINLSAQTQASNIVDAMEDALDKKRKTLLGPPAGKRMVVFVDDLNMPAKEEYGAMPPVELLRQGIDQKGFYDTAKLFFKSIADCIFCAACAPPGGGRSEVTPRLERHFHMIWIESLSRPSMTTIFESILSGFLTHTAADLVEVAKPLVQSAVNVYKHVEQQMLPTPSKSHYTFNLRDLSKVFQGVLMVSPEYLSDEGALLRLWVHEELRVFRDRLVDDEDRSQFNVFIEEQLQSGKLAEVVTRVQGKAQTEADAKAAEAGEGAGDAASKILARSGPAAWRKEGFRDLLFGDYLSRDEKKYAEIVEPEKLPEVFTESLDEYNISFPTQMHLVFFRDAVAHISRVARILRQPRGNAMLVGVGGSGRQSLTRLSSFIAEFQCMGIEITRTYNKDAWREDLKRVLMQAGAKAKDVVFLFSDTQIKEESFLEDINNILNSGDVPNLYAPDEFESIIGDVRPLCKAAGKIDTRDNIWQHYISLVRSHLHVVLAFSPIGGSFRNRCRMFPSLVNCCTIDWFSAWPEDALFSVAESILGRSGGRPLGIEGMVDPLCNMCVKIHRSVEESSGRFLREKRRHNYTTPTSYLELIRLYTEMLTSQRSIVDGKISRYEGGLTKLADAETVVAELRVELTKLQPTLKKAAADTEALLKQLAVDQKDADEAAAQAQQDEEATTKQAAEVKIIKDDCQKDLDEALPAYYGALKALDSLDKAQINEVKGFKKPPELVVTVLEAVCILLGEKTDWNSAKKVMGDMKFIDRLKGFDKDSIDPKIIKKLGKYIKMDKFMPSEVKSVSLAATSLCMWVRAIFKYDAVAKNIEPKRNALNEAMASLEKAQSILEEKRGTLREIQAKVADLQRQYENSVNEKERLERQQKQTEVKLERAKKLIDGLGAEAGRWRQAQIQLAEDKKNLTGNMILSAGCIAYAGPFTADFRKRLSAGWVQGCQAKRIPVDPRFELSRILADPVEVREWNIQGLPADDFSTENGLFATRGRRWPLMIDPQGQANRWVKQMQKDNGLRVIKLSESDFLRTLEHGIRFGQPILLENVEEELDPALEPVLLKQIFKKQGLATLRLGDTDVPYSDDFRFYITTKLANPHYMPEVCVKVTVINFTVTMQGLEDQLLVDVVAHERPDLEERKNKLIVSIASDKRQLKGIEDSILKMLAEAQGDILEDESLIDSLGQSKKTSSAISERMEEAEKTTKEINEAREGYRTVATRGSVLYFVIADLANVNAMYQFSLQAFQRLYNMRIEKSEASEDLDMRLQILIRDITKSFYENLCRGLFESDKMLYSFLIAVSIARQAGDISDEEWQYFLVGSAAKDDEGKAQFPPTKEWLSAKGWIQTLGLEKALGSSSPLAGIADDFGTQQMGWQEFAQDENPHLAKLPQPWDDRLSNFQRLLVLRCAKEEKTNFGVREFVRRQLGEKFCEPPPFDLEGVFEDSTSTMPIVFVLSAGADPVQYLLKLAEEKGKRDSLRIISLGQGQGPLAERHMEEARRSGDWVCLQNCHLAESWLPRLEAILEQTMGAGAGSSDIHQDFRLWLTSMPNPKFPVPVLQNSIKLTQEPPRGLKANLRRTFLDLSEKEYEGCSKPRPYKKLLFGLAFYHALILERRKFGAIGWNIPYEWMNSDLQTGMMQLKMYLEEQPNIPYETLNAVIGDITYGGRATDAWDKRTNLSILRRFFCPEVLQDGYHFSESGLYFAPEEGDLASAREYIEHLPLDDPPDTFGLHPNAAITLQQKESNELMSTLVNMQKGEGGGGGSGGTSPDEVVSAIVEDVLKRLPEPYDSSQAHPETFATIDDGSINSLGVFAEQEMVRFNGLTRVMRASLLEMRKAIKGLVVMSPELEAMYGDFQFQRVPVQWEDAAYPSLKPLSSWIEDLMLRLAALDLWLKDGPPRCFWLSGFFFPQGFMTGALQTYARKTRIAIDTLTFKTNIMSMDKEDVAVAPEDGVYVYGLFLEGARWDREAARLSEMKAGVLFDYMPCIWLEPVEQSNFQKQELDYDCPVYKTSRRAGTLSTTGHSTNFIVTLQLGSSKPSDHWIRRGVALLSQLDD